MRKIFNLKIISENLLDVQENSSADVVKAAGVNFYQQVGHQVLDAETGNYKINPQTALWIFVNGQLFVKTFEELGNPEKWTTHHQVFDNNEEYKNGFAWQGRYDADSKTISVNAGSSIISSIIPNDLLFALKKRFPDWGSIEPLDCFFAQVKNWQKVAVNDVNEYCSTGHDPNPKNILWIWISGNFYDASLEELGGTDKFHGNLMDMYDISYEDFDNAWFGRYEVNSGVVSVANASTEYGRVVPLKLKETLEKIFPGASFKCVECSMDREKILAAFFGFNKFSRRNNWYKKKAARMYETQIYTQEFKNWFGDWENDPENSSKIVDGQGYPLTVYHGTGSNFNQFLEEKIGEGAGGNDWGEGFYFTKYNDVASNYAEREENNSPNVIPVYLSIKNPVSIEKLIQENREIAGMLQDPYPGDDLRGILIDMGYDGIIYQDGLEIIAFSAEQIKSAIGNSGNFKRDEKNILF